MTRNTGQITTVQALTGAFLIVAVAAGMVAALSLLTRREQAAPQEAPAVPADPESCPDAPAATPAVVTADELIECPRTYDGALVRYRGEAVRAILPRGDRAWLHLNDDPYALELGPLPQHRITAGSNTGIPVSITNHLAQQITHVGDGRHHGDVLTVTGIFHRAEPAAAGGPTIQARTTEITQPGQPITRPFTPARALIAGLLTIAALATTLQARASTRR